MWGRLSLPVLLLSFLHGGCGGDDGAGSTDAGPAGDAASDDAGFPEGAVAVLEQGVVRGEEAGDLVIFRGIPYAEPPLGDLRYRPPRAHPGWDEPLDATAFGPVCPQRERMGTAVIGEEDCLTLNVWAPAARGPRPVMVFLHGGASIQGAGSLGLYEASELARGGDVVVVTLNYRLGTLGFLALEALAGEGAEGSAGNYGIRDQVLALEWVQRNVKSFGGDPEQVTIFGESAGGVSVCVHLASPLSEGLFARAVIQSGGGCFNFAALRARVGNHLTAIETGEELVAAAGCDGAPEPLACMREKPAEALVEAMYAGTTSGLGLPDIGPVVDGVVLPDQPWDLFDRGEGNEVPIVTGSNADEAYLFTTSISVPDEAAYEALIRSSAGALADDLLALYPAAAFASPKAAYDALFSDIAFICPALAFAEVTAGGASPSYAYHFTKTLEGAGAAFGSFHALELFYLFGTFGELPLYTPVEVDLRVSDLLQTAWTGFAHDGEPRTDPAWPPYDPLAPSIAILDDPFRLAPEIREGRCAALQGLGIVPTPGG